MMAMFRYIYNLPYESVNEDSDADWQFLANVYVAADKYQVEGLGQDVVEHMHGLWELSEMESSFAEDFLAAVRIIFDGTTNQDYVGRSAMVNLCVCYIREMNELPEFKTLLNDCDDLGAGILAHSKLGLMLEGRWACRGSEGHRAAIPRCPYCTVPYSLSCIRVNRDKIFWACPDCEKKAQPICTDNHGPIVCDWVLFDEP